MGYRIVESDIIIDQDIEYLGFIPHDSEIEKISLDGSSLMNLKEEVLSLIHLRKLGEKIWQRN